MSNLEIGQIPRLRRWMKNCGLDVKDVISMSYELRDTYVACDVIVDDAGKSRRLHKLRFTYADFFDDAYCEKSIRPERGKEFDLE